MALLVAGCGGPALHVKPIPDPRDPQSLVLRFEKDIQAARADEVHILAPEWFTQAESSLLAAREALAAGRDPLPDLARGRAQLLSARDASQIVRALMPEVIQNRRLARKAGAADLDAAYRSVEDTFRKTARAAEAGNTEPAVRLRKNLAKAYRRLELQAIKSDALADIHHLLQQAERENTPQWAPRSYDRALAQLDQAEALIERDRYNSREIQRAADSARFYAQRHLAIADQCRIIEAQSAEAVVLNFEQRLHSIAARLNAPDLRDHSLDMQVENILGAITAQQHDRSTVIEEQKLQVEALQSRIEKLDQRRQQERMAQERLQGLFRQVETLFDRQEAALQLRDGRIVIRLRAMQFAVGQSKILPGNKSLLEKVGRALALFEDFDVIIEGHTDNLGSDQVNEALSEHRAEAVRHYLVMNHNLPYDRMIAVGYGASRPLAANTTEAGRAVNRRIDLIVIPRLYDP